MLKLNEETAAKKSRGRRQRWWWRWRWRSLVATQAGTTLRKWQNQLGHVCRDKALSYLVMPCAVLSDRSCDIMQVANGVERADDARMTNLMFLSISAFWADRACATEESHTWRRLHESFSTTMHRCSSSSLLDKPPRLHLLLSECNNSSFGCVCDAHTLSYHGIQRPLSALARDTVIGARLLHDLVASLP